MDTYNVKQIADNRKRFEDGFVVESCMRKRHLEKMDMW